MSRGHNGETGALRLDSQVTEGSKHQAALGSIEHDKGPETDAYWGGARFCHLPDGGPAFVWNVNYDPSAETASAQYK
jgi:hypothetical protein